MGVPGVRNEQTNACTLTCLLHALKSVCTFPDQFVLSLTLEHKNFGHKKVIWRHVHKGTKLVEPLTSIITACAQNTVVI